MPSDPTAVLADVDSMLRGVLGDFGPEAEISRETSFSADLGMESLDVVSLAGRLQARYGNSVNFALFVSTLDVASVGELTVGQLVDYITASLDKVPAAS